MNEKIDTRVDGMCPPDYTGTGFHLQERSDAQRPLEAFGSNHGQLLENPPQSAPKESNFQIRRTTDLAHICLPRRRNFVNSTKPCQKKQMEAMGDPKGIGGNSLHPDIKAGYVTRPTGTVSTENVIRLLEYQQYRCALTNRELTPEKASLDHIIPVTLGGEHTIENVQVLHKDVNRAKGSFTNEKFIGICQDVVRWLENRPGSPVCGDPAAIGAVHPVGNDRSPAQNLQRV